MNISSLLSILALGAAAVAAVRVLAKEPVYREACGRPIATAVLAMAAVAAAMAIAEACRRVDGVLPVLAAVAGVLAVLAWIRARPGYGRSRGMPPGSLGVGASLDAISDPTFYARAARRWGPVFKMAQFHRPVVCIVGLRRGLEVLATARENLAQPKLPFGQLSPEGYIQFMDGPVHDRYRELFRAAINGRVLSASRSGIEYVVRQQLAAMRACDREGGVDPDPFLDRIALAGLVRVMYGIAVDDPRFGRLEGLFEDLGQSFAERRPARRRATFDALAALVRARGVELLAQPDAPASVLGEILRADPAHLRDDTVIANLVLMVQATRGSVRGLLSWILKELSDTGWWDATGEAGSIEARATNVVNETLRRHQAEYFYRDVVRDFRLGPYRIRRGWLLRVCMRESHDDPAVFPEPERFDPGRFADRQYDRTEYCPFGEGPHSCLAPGVSIAIARTLVLAVATEFEVRVVADGPVERAGNRHWSHWRPSRRLRVAVRGGAERPA